MNHKRSHSAGKFVLMVFVAISISAVFFMPQHAFSTLTFIDYSNNASSTQSTSSSTSTTPTSNSTSNTPTTQSTSSTPTTQSTSNSTSNTPTTQSTSSTPT
ncbi:MAG: hypothetical protein WAN47_01045, partial [Nitrosotalea sp.]